MNTPPRIARSLTKQTQTSSTGNCFCALNSVAWQASRMIPVAMNKQLMTVIERGRLRMAGKRFIGPRCGYRSRRRSAPSGLSFCFGLDLSHLVHLALPVVGSVWPETRVFRRGRAAGDGTRASGALVFPAASPISQKSPSLTTLRLSDWARILCAGDFRPPRAPAQNAPAPATPARSCAGCSSTRRSPRSADSLPAPRPNTGSTRGVPDC